MHGTTKLKLSRNNLLLVGMFHFTMLSVPQSVANGVCISRRKLLFVSVSTLLLNFMTILLILIRQNHHLRPIAVENLEGHTKYYKLPNDSEL